jgi:Protein of unknown function (DUF3570)
MRLQLTVATITVMGLVGTSAAAQDVVRADARAGIYQDSDHTTIGTATTAVRGTIEDVITLKGRYLADIISSASVDVISAATDHFDEIRHEAEGGVTYADGTNTINGTYIYSIENDWSSHTGAAGVGRDFFDHQLTLGLGGSFVFNDVGRQDDDNFAEELLIGSVTASAAIVASPDDLVSLAYSLTYASGYQASPYRFAYLGDPTGLTIGAPENHPDRRVRHALAVRYNRYLFKHTALRSHARVYTDDWGIVSGTAGTELLVGFPPFEVGARVRGYLQGPAAFYEAVYPAAQRYMTADRELGAFADVFAGGVVALRHDFNATVETLEVEARVDGFYFKYFDFPRLPQRTGLTAELGLGISF